MRFSKIDFSNSLVVAVVFAMATIAVSCQPKLGETQIASPDTAPNQVVEGMSAVQSRNSLRQMRIEAPLMEIFNQDPEDSYELFPKGFVVYGYNEQGFLETEIVAKRARHRLVQSEETWEAYGDVVVRNFVKGTRIDTDTLYWDKENAKIYTPQRCYVFLQSPDGAMQGFGMESDEMARNALLLHPFDSYAYVGRDSTEAGYVDSVNFIGPHYKTYR
ncbi:MAG: LPS export ABC transporter periplasmic protein LptC [Bacteroidales bacterium]|jgi:LPS export ABC transporter protein LptC|nr:LPS export ABC transporter periplasmic protein LptC [Bacteroidales bacterium]